MRKEGESGKEEASIKTFPAWGPPHNNLIGFLKMRIKGFNLEVGLLLFSEIPMVVPAEPTILLQSLMRVL